MVIKFLEQFVLIARALERQGLYDADDGVLLRPARLPVGRVDAGEGADDLGPAPGAPGRRAAAARRRAGRAARQAVRAPARELGGDRRNARSAGCARLGDDRSVLVSVIDPDELRHTLQAFFDEAAFLSPHGLRAVSKRYEGNPYTLEGVDGRVDRLRAGRVDHDHVRRQLELARPDLDAAQLPRDPPVRRSTSGSSATSSSSSTRPARARSAPSARSRRTSPTGSSRSGCRRRRPPAASTAAPSGCRRIRLEGQPPLQRVLPRRQRSRPRRDAPDRLDGARRRPDPRPAASWGDGRPRHAGRVRGRRPVGRAAAARCSAREGVA